jgi:hypothetical protein
MTIPARIVILAHANRSVWSFWTAIAELYSLFFGAAAYLAGDRPLRRGSLSFSASRVPSQKKEMPESLGLPSKDNAKEEIQNNEPQTCRVNSNVKHGSERCRATIVQEAIVEPKSQTRGPIILRMRFSINRSLSEVNFMLIPSWRRVWTVGWAACLLCGTELSIAGGRGFAEPSLAHFQGTYYLILRNDAAAYVATSDDGLKFGRPRAWTFDDGKDLGSYNTQAHWLTHSEGLFLTYTRRGANNDHIARHRAPLFIAQINPQSLQVIRSTEQILLPERGVMLGNFGASPITAQESWVTDAEFISRLVDPNAGTRPHPKGADGTVWVGRAKWSKPNPLATGTTISTKEQR